MCRGQVIAPKDLSKTCHICVSGVEARSQVGGGGGGAEEGQVLGAVHLLVPLNENCHTHVFRCVESTRSYLLPCDLLTISLTE